MGYACKIKGNSSKQILKVQSLGNDTSINIRVSYPKIPYRILTNSNFFYYINTASCDTNVYPAGYDIDYTGYFSPPSISYNPNNGILTVNNGEVTLSDRPEFMNKHFPQSVTCSKYVYYII